MAIHAIRTIQHKLTVALVSAGLLAGVGCGPVFDEPPSTFDICLPPDGGVDQLAPIVQRTRPFAPRQLQQNQAEAWSSSRGMAVAGDLLYVVDRDNGALVVMNATTLAVQETIAVGARPDNVLLGPDGTAYVSVRHAGQIAVIEKGAKKVSRTMDVGVEPIGMAMTPGGKELLVTLAGEGVVVAVDPATGAELRRIDAKGDRPRAVTVVTDPNAPSKWLISIANQNGPARALRYDPAANNGVYSDVDLRGNNPAQDGFGGPLRSWRAISATVSPETGETLYAHVLVSPGDDGTLLNSVFHGDPISNGKSQSVSQSSGGYGASGPSCTGGTPIRPIEVAVTAASTKPSKTVNEFAIESPETGRNILAGFDQPSDIIHHPSVSLAFVAAYGTDNVLVLNTGAGDPMRFPLATIDVGMAPRAMAISADGKRLFVLNEHSFTVSEVDLQPLLSKVVADYPEAKSGEMPPQLMDAPYRFSATRAAAFGVDNAPEAVRQGRRIFTFSGNEKISAAGRFACASCHLEGEEDKQTWFITDGPRQTPSLAGRLQGTGPFNWVGSESGLQDNMDRTIERMGGEGLAKSELAALEQFMLHGLHERPNPNRGAKLTEAQERGRQIFNDPEVGCAGCHAGDETTDGKLWDVGTASASEKQVAELTASLKGEKIRPVIFNTPSLRGLHHTAPYLHDGSEKTLLGLLNRTGNSMGKTSHLTSAQKNDLVAYLLTL
ncbi:MAG: c-type cytochrome [Deltaproteobacteria bacterium]|nr:c-type cytochrome [Deltaproteobacteria bacterium]